MLHQSKLTKFGSHYQRAAGANISNWIFPFGKVGFWGTEGGGVSWIVTTTRFEFPRHNSQRGEKLFASFILESTTVKGVAPFSRWRGFVRRTTGWSFRIYSPGARSNCLREIHYRTPAHPDGTASPLLTLKVYFHERPTDWRREFVRGIARKILCKFSSQFSSNAA